MRLLAQCELKVLPLDEVLLGEDPPLSCRQPTPPTLALALALATGQGVSAAHGTRASGAAH